MTRWPEGHEPPKEPEFMPLEEQTELFAQRIKNLGRFQFLLRPAIAEGHIGKEVVRLSIRDEDRDKETGAYQFPEAHLMQRLRAALGKHSGIPLKRLLAEQEKRIPPSLPETPYRLPSPQPRQPSRQTRQHTQPKPPTDGAQATTPDVATVTSPAGRQDLPT
jgi:hypothetical protein